jgi:hypothetical protein
VNSGEADASTQSFSKPNWRGELRRQAILHGGAASVLAFTSLLGPWDPAAGSPIELWWPLRNASHPAPGLRDPRPGRIVLRPALARLLETRRGEPRALSPFEPAPRQFFLKRPQAAEKSGLRLASANLLFINHETAELIQGLRDFDPDLILLQEVTDH